MRCWLPACSESSRLAGDRLNRSSRGWWVAGGREPRALLLMLAGWLRWLGPLWAQWARRRRSATPVASQRPRRA
eukprot:COSAG01_NODE_155_length_23814_cov_12.061343_5_plen_74_part_00